MATKAQGIEDEGKKATINIKDLTDALQNFKEEKEMSDEKVRARLELLADEDKDIRKKLEEFIEDQDKIDDKQNKELVIRIYLQLFLNKFQTEQGIGNQKFFAIVSE
jgi:hypothetical protein